MQGVSFVLREEEMMRRDFAGDQHPLFFGGANQKNLLLASHVANVKGTIVHVSQEEGSTEGLS